MFTLWKNIVNFSRPKLMFSIYENCYPCRPDISFSSKNFTIDLYISGQTKKLVASVFLSLQKTSEFYFQFFYYIELLLMSKVRTLDYMFPFKGGLKKEPGVKNICTQRNSIREQRGNELVSVLIRKAIIKAQRLGLQKSHWTQCTGKDETEKNRFLSSCRVLVCHFSPFQQTNPCKE